MKGPVGEMTGGNLSFADHLSRGGIIEDVEILGVQQGGDTANVRAQITYDREELAQRNEGKLFPEHNPVEQRPPFVRENRMWKVSVADLSEGE